MGHAVIGVSASFAISASPPPPVQRQSITTEQSRRCWINLLVGVVLGVVAVALGPFVACVLSRAASGRRHRCPRHGLCLHMLPEYSTAPASRRQMRFVTLSIDRHRVAGGQHLHRHTTWRCAFCILVARRHLTVTPLVYTSRLVASRWVRASRAKHTEIFHMMRFGRHAHAEWVIMYFAMTWTSSAGRFLGRRRARHLRPRLFSWSTSRPTI